MIASRAADGVAAATGWARRTVPGIEAAIEAFERERSAGGGLLAGGLAYRFFFWLVPFGLVVGALGSFWVENDRAAFEDTAHEFGIGALAAGTAGDALEEGAHSRWYLLVVGVLTLFWFSMGAARALRGLYALAWRERPGPGSRPFAAAALFNSGVLLLIALGTAGAWLRAEFGVAGFVLTVLVVVLLAAGALAAMSVLPHGDAPLRALVPGALLVAVGMQGIHLFVVIYLAPRFGRSSELYGTLGAATTILLWLYLTARLITLAAYLNATLWERHRRSGPVAVPQAPLG